jgi:hypothetical protein
MPEVRKKPIQSLGYNFVAKEFIPNGKDEYYLRNIQNRSGINYRNLTKNEINLLKGNNNVSDDWNKILVADPFDQVLQFLRFDTNG